MLSAGLPIEKIMIAKSICLYRMDLAVFDDGVLFDTCYAAMPMQRKLKIDRMRFSAGKRQSLGAGVLLYAALCEHGLRPEDLTFAENTYGKTEIPSLKDLFRFNLSHTDGVAICAVHYSPDGHAREIGCDVETVYASKSGIAERFFAREEKDVLCGMSSEKEKTDLFFRLWTLKESFVKATGLGFSLPFDRFAVLIEPNGSVGIRQNVVEGTCSFWDRREGNCHYAVCMME